MNPELQSKSPAGSHELQALFSNFWEVIECQSDILKKSIEKRKVNEVYSIQ